MHPAAKPSAQGVGGSEPTRLGQFGDWGAYTANPSGRRTYFALAKPVKSESVPPNLPRTDTFVFISSRPAENVRNEVSVMFGFVLKLNVDAELEIGGVSFSMATEGDSAWIKNPADESRLVELMLKTSDMTVKGVSSRGTRSSDVYSMKGLDQALNRIAQECR
jgi:hypothetical protein